MGRLPVYKGIFEVVAVVLAAAIHAACGRGLAGRWP